MLPSPLSTPPSFLPPLRAEERSETAAACLGSNLWRWEDFTFTTISVVSGARGAVHQCSLKVAVESEPPVYPNSSDGAADFLSAAETVYSESETFWSVHSSSLLALVQNS